MGSKILSALLPALLALASPCFATDTIQVRDLPLVELPAAQPGGRMLALVISGDGDWAPFIRGASQTLVQNGISVVGLKARSYLSRPRTPEETARDAERILRYYLPRWNRSEVMLVGYSRGADMVPFVANRLPADLRSRIRLIAMAGPEQMASFEFHPTDLIRSNSRATDIPTLPEVTRLRGTRMLCVYGSGERNSLCPTVPRGLMRVVSRTGGHLSNDHELFASLILEELETAGRR